MLPPAHLSSRTRANGSGARSRSSRASTIPASSRSTPSAKTRGRPTCHGGVEGAARRDPARRARPRSSDLTGGHLRARCARPPS
jgi:hypothetical protein